MKMGKSQSKLNNKNFLISKKLKTQSPRNSWPKTAKKESVWSLSSTRFSSSDSMNNQITTNSSSTSSKFFSISTRRPTKSMTGMRRIWCKKWKNRKELKSQKCVRSHQQRFSTVILQWLILTSLVTGYHNSSTKRKRSWGPRWPVTNPNSDPMNWDSDDAETIFEWRSDKSSTSPRYPQTESRNLSWNQITRDELGYLICTERLNTGSNLPMISALPLNFSCFEGIRALPCHQIYIITKI